MNDHAELPIEAAIRLAGSIARNHVFITDGTRSVTQEWGRFSSVDFDERPDLLEAVRETSSSLIGAVIHDCENMAIACEQLEEIKSLLIVNGNPTELAEELATHSEGSSRVVGKLGLMPYKSSFADMVNQFDAFVFAAGNDASGVSRLGSDTPLCFKEPGFWRALRDHIENLHSPSVDSPSLPSLVVTVARALNRMLPEDFAGDAITELLTYRKALVCSESKGSRPVVVQDPRIGSLLGFQNKISQRMQSFFEPDRKPTPCDPAANNSKPDEALAELRKPTHADRSAFYATLAINAYIEDKYGDAPDRPETQQQKWELLSLVIDTWERAELEIDDNWKISKDGRALFEAARRFEKWILAGNPDIKAS